MAELMLVNPKKRRKSKKRKSPARKGVSVRRRRSVARKAPTRRRRRNPIGGSKPMDQIMNAATGAAGALAVDVVMAKLPLPAQMTGTPIMMSASQGLVSLVIGMAVSRFGKKRKLGQQLAEGGLTVALHGMGKGLIGPTLGLSGWDDSLLGIDDSLLGYEAMGAYDDLGWMGAGATSMGPGDMQYEQGFEVDEDDFYD